MTLDLATASVSEFEGRVSETFTIEFTDASLSLELIETRSLGSGERPGGAFSLLFSGPREPMLQQGTYRLETGQETLEVFLVPVNQTDDAAHYEAVFT